MSLWKTTETDGSDSLCNSVSSVSLWLVLLRIINHRGTEGTEVAQRRAGLVTCTASLIVLGLAFAGEFFFRLDDGAVHGVDPDVRGARIVFIGNDHVIEDDSVFR